MSFFSELKRRNIFRVGIAYVSAAWVLLQSLDVVTPLMDWPDSASKIAFTVLAIGFIPVLIFAWAFEITPEGLKPAKQVDRTKSITAVTGRKLDFTIIAVLSLAVVLLLVDRYIGEAAPESEQIVEKSIAVLPFVNMSSDTEQEYFSDGITEEILNALAAVNGLKVAGRTSSFAFKGQNQDLREIGETLGVEHILEGSVRKAGTKIRITAQLIQVEDGFHMWSDTYDRELTDVFQIQDEIANEIIKQLRARLLDEESEIVTAQRTMPDVYEKYLLAKQRIYDRSGPSLEFAVELLDEAIQADPGYAPAYAQRGIATILLSEFDYGTIPYEEANRQGKRFIDMALDRDDELAEAWAALGLYHNNRPAEYEEAVEALTKALSLNPNLINASNWLYGTFMDRGDVQSAVQIAEDMTRRDPLYRPAFANAVRLYDQLRQEEKSRALIERFRRFDTFNAQLLRTEAIHHISYGRIVEAYPLAMRAHEVSPTDAGALIAFSAALALTGQFDRVAEEGFEFFKVYALDVTGHREEAFDMAQNLARLGYPNNLFAQYNRASRSRELVDYLEERWPSLDAFASDNPKNVDGWSTMEEVTYAYSHVGNTARFHQALEMLGSAIGEQAEQGVDSWGFNISTARYLALAGRNDEALDELERSFANGMQGGNFLSPEADPLLDSLRGEPRFVALAAQITDSVNSNRKALGLSPQNTESMN